MKKMREMIIKRRKELGLTQRQLANLLGISFQAVSKWENERVYPDVVMLPKLAAVLGTTVDALLGYSGKARGMTENMRRRGITGDLSRILSAMIL